MFAASVFGMFPNQVLLFRLQVLDVDFNESEALLDVVKATFEAGAKHKSYLV